MHTEVKEYDVLGHNIRLRETSGSEGTDSISPDEVVELVMAEVEKLRVGAPNLGDSQAAVLVALKLAQDKISLDREYKSNVASLQATAKDALRLVEEVVPTTH